MSPGSAGRKAEHGPPSDSPSWVRSTNRGQAGGNPREPASRCRSALRSVGAGNGRRALLRSRTGQRQRRQPRRALHHYRIFARPHQIAYCLIGRTGHVDRRELACARQPGLLRHRHRGGPPLPLGAAPLPHVTKRLRYCAASRHPSALGLHLDRREPDRDVVRTALKFRAVTTGMVSFIGEHGIECSALMAPGAIWMVPMIVRSFCSSRSSCRA